MNTEFEDWFENSGLYTMGKGSARAAWDKQQEKIDALEARLEAKQQAAAEDHQDAA